jgi:uncharacterized protein with PIN domain
MPPKKITDKKLLEKIHKARLEKMKKVSHEIYHQMKDKDEYVFCEKCGYNVKKVSYPMHLTTLRHLNGNQEFQTCPICNKNVVSGNFKKHCQKLQHKDILKMMLKLCDREKLDEYIRMKIGDDEEIHDCIIPV